MAIHSKSWCHSEMRTIEPQITSWCGLPRQYRTLSCTHLWHWMMSCKIIGTAHFHLLYYLHAFGHLFLCIAIKYCCWQTNCRCTVVLCAVEWGANEQLLACQQLPDKEFASPSAGTCINFVQFVIGSVMKIFICLHIWFIGCKPIRASQMMPCRLSCRSDLQRDPAGYRVRFFGKYSRSCELCFGSRYIGWLAGWWSKLWK